MKTRVAVVLTHLPDYKVHLYSGLARRPGFELMMWHGPAAPGLDLPDVDPGDAFPHRSARQLHLKIGLPLIWQRVHRELWDYNPHVIVLDEFVKIVSHWPILIEARRRGVPVVLYGHGENRERNTTRGRFLGELIERARLRMHRLASAVVVYTDESARKYRARHPHTPCFVSPNTLDTSAIADQIAQLPSDHREKFRAELGVPKGALLVANVGRLVRQHDPLPLIAAVARARGEGADVHLMSIGSGPLEEAVRAKVAQLAPNDRAAIHLAPRQTLVETTRRLAACDAYAHAGTVGLAINHALAVGLPFVAHAHDDHGPEIEYLQNGENGLLLSDYESSLVAALLRLSREPAWRRELGENALRYTREKLSPEAQVAGFAAAIDDALGRSPLSRPTFSATDGTSKGTADGAFNGAFNGASDGTANGTLDGTSNGAPDGVPDAPMQAHG